MPKTPNSRKSFSISQVFRRRKNRLQPRQEKIWSTTVEASSAGDTPSPSSSRQTTVPSSTESKDSDTTLTNRENKHYPSRWAHSRDTIYPLESSSTQSFYPVPHDEPNLKELSGYHTPGGHSIYGFDTTSTERHHTLGTSEFILPSRNSTDTPFSPITSTLHYSPEYSPAETAFNQDDLAERRFPGPTRSSPKETSINRSPAELDVNPVSRPFYAKSTYSFGSEFILPRSAPTEHTFGLLASNSITESPVIAPSELTFKVRHGSLSPELEFPIEGGSSHSVDLFGYSVLDDTRSNDDSEHDVNIIEGCEDGNAYEDDEARCGKCGGYWWKDKDRYNTGRRVPEELIEGEIENFRCHRCKQVRIRKKHGDAVEADAVGAEVMGSVESFRTATGMVSINYAYKLWKLTIEAEDVHPREVEEDSEEMWREEEEKKKAERRKIYVPGEWPEI